MEVGRTMALTPQQQQLQRQQQQLQNQQRQQLQQQQLQRQKACLQLAYQDAWRVCNPDFKRPFSSLEDACERLLPYHVVADYEEEDDDNILDSAIKNGQILSRTQQWDSNIAAKVLEYTTAFEKQVHAFNVITQNRSLSEFRTEEKLMVEQLLLHEERRSFLELRAQMDRMQRASRETHHDTTNTHMAEMMSRALRRGTSSYGAGGSTSNNTLDPSLVEQDQDFNQGDVVNGWGGNVNEDDKEPSEDFLNDDEAENGDTASNSAGRRGGELDLNAR